MSHDPDGYIVKIHGMQRGSQSYSSQGEQFTLSEEVLVEAKSPLTTLSQVVGELPNFRSGPGSTTFNPYQLTFTLKISTHPESSDFYLDSVSNMKRKDPDSNFWIIPVTYITPHPSAITAQQVNKPKSKKKKNRTRISDPMDRPASFSMAISTLTQPTYTDRYQRTICHTNGLPIEQPLQQTSDRWSLNFQWNIEIDDITAWCTSVQQLTNGTNKQALYIKDTDGKNILLCPKRTIMGTGAKLNEIFEKPSDSTLEYHYARVGFTAIVTPSRQVDEPQISRHTLQLLESGLPSELPALHPITINPAGGKAKQPWPLDAEGGAIPYADVAVGNLDEVGHLICLPNPEAEIQEIDRNVEINEWVDADIWTNFFDKHGLHFPGKREN